MNEMYNDIIDDLIIQFDGYEGTSIYGCDLAYTLFEGYNIDGSVLYNTYLSRDWLNKNREDVGWHINRMKEYGYEFADGFEEPEKLMVQIYLTVADEVIQECPTVMKKWNEQFELTKTRINKIIEELEDSKSLYK